MYQLYWTVETCTSPYLHVEILWETGRDHMRPRFCFECLKLYLNHSYTVNRFATFELQFGSTRKCHTHLWFRTVQLFSWDHAVLANPCRSDVWSLGRKVMKRVNLHIVHVFTLICCIFMAILISMWSVIAISNHVLLVYLGFVVKCGLCASCPLSRVVR